MHPFCPLFMRKGGIFFGKKGNFFGWWAAALLSPDRGNEARLFIHFLTTQYFIMKLKSLLLGAAFAATATIFTYCTKDTTQPTVPEIGAVEEVTERGVCPITVQALNCTADLCGMQNNANACGLGFVGTATVANGATSNFTLVTPTIFRASINHSFPVGANPSIRVSGAGVIKVYPLTPNLGGPAVSPTTVKINDFCVPQ
jgi:hypothetical protein